MGKKEVFKPTYPQEVAMAKLLMTKPMVLASLIVLSAYTPGPLVAQDARACQKKCVEKMQQCLPKSSMPSMRMSNTPPDMKKLHKPNTKCVDDKRACERACK
jgi:hypothetical protein